MAGRAPDAVLHAWKARPFTSRRAAMPRHSCWTFSGCTATCRTKSSRSSGPECATRRAGSRCTFLAQAVNRGHLVAPAGCYLRGLGLLGGAESLVRKLLEHGCDLNAAIEEPAPGFKAAAVGFTALHLLAKPHHKWSPEELDDVLAFAEAILRNGGRVDPHSGRGGRTPMAIAASSGQAELVQLLVRYGADPRALEGDGITPIELCRRGRQNAMANLLAELAARSAASAALQAAVAARA